MTHVQRAALWPCGTDVGTGGAHRAFLDPCRCSVSSHRPPQHSFPRLLQDWGRSEILCSFRLFLKLSSFSLKRDLLPLECQDKKTFSNFPWKLRETPISTQDLSLVSSPAASPSEELFAGSVRVVTETVSLLWGVLFLSCSGIWQGPPQPVSLQHTEWEIKGRVPDTKLGLGLPAVSLQMHSKIFLGKKGCWPLSRWCSKSCHDD